MYIIHFIIGFIYFSAYFVLHFFHVWAYECVCGLSWLHVSSLGTEQQRLPLS